jgi:hypothetical protein
MSHLDPYAPIEKVPLLTHDGMRSRGFTVRLEDDTASAGWKEVGIVSEDYLLVPNSQVRDMAREITDRTDLSWHESKTFFDGKRFVHALTTHADTLTVRVAPNDVLSLGLLFENSYDGSRRLAVSLYANRIVCSNGLIVPQFFSRLRFKHTTASLGWEEETERALAVISSAGVGLRQFADMAKRLSDTYFGTKEMEMVRRRGLSRLPVGLWGKVIDRYLLHEDQHAWGFLNAGTNVVWHNEKGTVQDFNHNELITSALIEFGKTGGYLLN